MCDAHSDEYRRPSTLELSSDRRTIRATGAGRYRIVIDMAGSRARA